VSKKSVEFVQMWLETVYGVNEETGPSPREAVKSYEVHLGNSRASRVLATFTREEIEGE